MHNQTQDQSVVKSLADAKSELGDILDTMLKFPDEYEAVSPSEELSATRRLLSMRERNIVVCGEARQGKSQFINALLGQPILPVDVVVTTSQVFRIGNAESESFFIVFEDGIRKEISKEEIAKYGKQSDDTLVDEPLFVGRKLKWIEVNVPAPNLPEGLHILDTPGLGALYARHAEIALQHIETADAVVFIKDKDAPLKDSELSMLETIFTVTQNVLFVLTKKDLINQSQIVDLCERNTAILKMRFGGSIKRQFKFWPVSSEMFLSSEGDKEIREESGFPAILKALANLFERTTDFTCSQMAYCAAHRYFGQAGHFRKERLASLSSCQNEANSLLAEKRSRLDAYNAKWGKEGSLRVEYEGKIADVISRCRTLFQNMFSPIQQRFVQKINALTLGDIDAFNKKMGQAVVDDLQKRIKDITGEASKELSKISSDVVQSIEVTIGRPDDLIEVKGGRIGSQIAAGVEGAISAAFKTSLVLSAVGIVTGVAVTAAEVLAVAATLTGPIGLALAGLLFLGGRKAVIRERERQLAQAQNALKNNLQSIVSSARTVMLVGDGMEKPTLEKWLFDTKNKALSVIRTLVDKEKERLTAEIRVLEVDAAADAAQRNETKEKLIRMGETLVSIRSRLIPVHDFLEQYEADEAHAI